MKVLGIQSLDELNETEYVIVNEDTLKLTQSKSEADISYVLKFIQNPIRIENEDELYDLLELNKGLPTKYFFIFNAQKGKPKDFSIQ